MKAAESQYPEATRRVEEGLAHLVSRGELDGPILGGQLLWLSDSMLISLEGPIVKPMSLRHLAELEEMSED